MFYLCSLKNGNVDNGHFRRQLVRSIINSIFVYDNPDGGKKIVVNFNPSNNEIDTLSLSDSDMNLLGAPIPTNLNIFVNKDWFTIVFDIKEIG